MAYDSTSRSNLEEKLGYERFVLKEAVGVHMRYIGVESPLEIVINDAPPPEMRLTMNDYMDASGQIEVIRSMAPLIFVAAFKVCDMVIEWVLEENGRSPSGPFWS